MHIQRCIYILALLLPMLVQTSARSRVFGEHVNVTQQSVVLTRDMKSCKGILALQEQSKKGHGLQHVLGKALLLKSCFHTRSSEIPQLGTLSLFDAFCNWRSTCNKVSVTDLAGNFLLLLGEEWAHLDLHHLAFRFLSLASFESESALTRKRMSPP